MNYGKKSVKQKKKALQSTSSKLGRKCLLTFSKVLLLCVIAIGIIGICAGLGVFKGIIDSAPTITLEDATPTRYSSFIYDSKGNQMAKLIAEDSNRVPLRWIRFPPIWQTPLSPSRMSVFTSTTVSTSWGFSVPA